MLYYNRLWATFFAPSLALLPCNFDWMSDKHIWSSHQLHVHIYLAIKRVYLDPKSIPNELTSNNLEHHLDRFIAYIRSTQNILQTHIDTSTSEDYFLTAETEPPSTPYPTNLQFPQITIRFEPSLTIQITTDQPSSAENPYPTTLFIIIITSTTPINIVEKPSCFNQHQNIISTLCTRLQLRSNP